jgi:hypothetical protein
MTKNMASGYSAWPAVIVVDQSPWHTKIKGCSPVTAADSTWRWEMAE